MNGRDGALHFTHNNGEMALLRENEMEEVPVFVGGIIPEEDAAVLKKLGVVAIFGPGSSLEDISRSIWEIIERE